MYAHYGYGRSFSGFRLALAAVVIAACAGLAAYFVSRDRWPTNAVYGVAEAIKDTTLAVKETSANAATIQAGCERVNSARFATADRL